MQYVLNNLGSAHRKDTNYRVPAPEYCEDTTPPRLNAKYTPQSRVQFKLGAWRRRRGLKPTHWPEFADLWQAVIGAAWMPASGATDPVARRRLRDEIDALAAHLYGLSRAEFAHILGAFPLVFPEDAQGRAKRAGVLAVYDKMG